MTRRYVRMPSPLAGATPWDDLRDSPMLSDLLVYVEDDSVPVPTGLYDRHGNELGAVREREPVGFVRFGARQG